jgi:hypothetical protein
MADPCVTQYVDKASPSGRTRLAAPKGLAAKPQWRCLIPMTHFAEAEGKKGAMTRTWVDIKGHRIVAWGWPMARQR